MISFISGAKFREISRNQSQFEKNEQNEKLLYLLKPSYDFNIFDIIPRTFMISSENKSSFFNVKLIKNVSPVIKNALIQDPQNRQYKLHNFRDPKNVLGKIEELLRGKFVFFEKDELPYVKEITNLLQITRCPEYMKIYHEDDEKCNLFNGVVMNPTYDCFLTYKVPKSFIIITNKKEYKCNIYGVYSSKLIRDLLRAQPNLKQYKYYFDDEFDEFQQICNVFNFQIITITLDNMYVLKEIAEHFKISPILKSINKFIQTQEKVSETIDEGQNSIDLINQLFEWIYNIKDLTVKNVTSLIMDSVWSKTDEDVRELAAFLLQAINHSISLHNELIELIISLGEELKLLIPFLIDKLLLSFGKTIYNCSFVYKLYRRNLIQKMTLKNKLSVKAKKADIKILNKITSWFLSELIEFNLFNESQFKNQRSTLSKFICSFLPDRIEQYKKMRDNDEPIEVITKTIQNDDVDHLQAIIMNNFQNISKYFIPYNIFEPLTTEKLSYLNYSALCGSIKCFKYLILNHIEVSQDTLNYAIRGGNIEIIKIVDQQLSNNKNSYPKFSKTTTSPKSKIIPLIKNHKNDLLDWVFEQKIGKNNLNDNLFDDLVFCAVGNGNIHALIEFIDNGYDINSKKWILLKIASENGFYRLLEFLVQIMKKSSSNFVTKSSTQFVAYGNLSIYKLFLKEFKPTNETIITVINSAINDKFMNIIDYFFDEQIQNGFKIDTNSIYNFLKTAISRKSNELFEYICEKLKKYRKEQFDKFDWRTTLLESAAFYKNVKGFFTVIELLPNPKNTYNFLGCLLNSISSKTIEICQYLIDNKLFTNFDLFLENSKFLLKTNKEIITLLMINCDEKLKESLLPPLLHPAIECHNLELVEYLINENILFDDSLIYAVSQNNSTIVELILKNKNVSNFINQGSYDGTALMIATRKNNLSIIKKLLSVPLINADLYDRNDRTALMIAVNNMNFDIVHEFLSFYKEKIFNNRKQLDFLITNLCVLPTLKNENVIKIFERLASFDKFKEIFDESYHKFLINLCSNESFISIIKLMLKANVDFNIHFAATGDTPLIIAIKNKNFGVAELLIKDQRTNINLKNYDKENALTISIHNKCNRIIELLFNNDKLERNESYMNFIFIISNAEISKIMLAKKFVDVNCRLIQKYTKKKVFQTALIQAVNSNDIDKFNLIINHQEFDKEKSLINEAIISSIQLHRNTFTRQLIALLSFEEMNKINNFALLLFGCQNDEILEELIKNKEFIISDDDIPMCCHAIFDIRNKSYKLLKLLFDYDQNHNKIINFNDSKYFTYFSDSTHSLQSHERLEQYKNIVNFLVQNSYDINSTPYNLFKDAIENVNLELIEALIHTKKVNYNKKIYCIDEGWNETTYFHLAAKSSNSKILELLIANNVLNSHNINTTDGYGYTPLMKACENLRKDNILLLFTINELNYIARNINKKNVLQILQSILAKKNDNKLVVEKTYFAKISKDLFYKKLIAAIDEINEDFEYDIDDDYNDVDYEEDIYEYDYDEDYINYQKSYSEIEKNNTSTILPNDAEKEKRTLSCWGLKLSSLNNGIEQQNMCNQKSDNKKENDKMTEQNDYLSNKDCKMADKKDKISEVDEKTSKHPMKWPKDTTKEKRAWWGAKLSSQNNGIEQQKMCNQKSDNEKVNDKMTEQNDYLSNKDCKMADKKDKISDVDEKTPKFPIKWPKDTTKVRKAWRGAKLSSQNNDIEQQNMCNKKSDNEKVNDKMTDESDKITNEVGKMADKKDKISDLDDEITNNKMTEENDKIANKDDILARKNDKISGLDEKAPKSPIKWPKDTTKEKKEWWGAKMLSQNNDIEQPSMSNQKSTFDENKAKNDETDALTGNSVHNNKWGSLSKKEIENEEYDKIDDNVYDYEEEFDSSDYYHPDISYQNSLVQQQINFITQFNYIRQAQLDLQMNLDLNMEIMKKSMQKQRRRRRKK